MPFREALASGGRGLRWTLPAAFEVAEDQTHAVLARDAERRVTWLLQHHPWPLDLRRAFDDALRADVEADARHLFEQAFKPKEWPPGSGETTTPRTADPSWSPIVDIGRVSVGGASALRVVRRIIYQPGDEVLSGSLLIPLADGFAELAALARANQTGFRESILMLKDASAEPTFLSQAEYDDPGHDAQFSEHPLSEVRAALRWLHAEAGVEVLAPAPEPPEGEQVLQAAGCAVTLPPRYLFVSRELMPMSPTLASFVRVGLGEAPMRLLDVWRLGEHVAGGDRAAALRRLAVESTARWTSEGASDIDQEATIVAADGPHVAVRTWVRFKVGPKPKVSAMCWRADEDGTVFRVSAGAAPYVPKSELCAEAEAVMASLRRLDPTAGGSAPEGSRKPWWKMW